MKVRRILPALLLSLVMSACLTAPAPPPQGVPTHQDASKVSEGAGVQDSAQGILRISTGDVLLHAPTVWRPHLTIAKCHEDLQPYDVCLDPRMADQRGQYPTRTGIAYEVVEADGNNVTTAGANQLWSGLSTAGLATPWNTTNTQLVVGDSSSAFSAGQTDMQAALGTKLNAADCTNATNASPIVVTCMFSPTPLVGQVVALSGFGGAGAAAINQTFEMSVASSSAATLLNSAGTGAITLAGGIVQPINKYRQLANAAGSAVITTNQIVYVATIGTTNANFTWNEWGMTTGGAATNKQNAPPPNLLNRAVVNLGTKTSASIWTATLTLTLS